MSTIGEAVAQAVAKQVFMFSLASCFLVGAVGITVGYVFGRRTAPPSAEEAMRTEERLKLLKKLSPHQQELLGINLTPHERKALGGGR